MQNDDAFWKRKLMAFLHDPPCKCFDIKGHEERARSFLGSAGIDWEEFTAFQKICDATAAAADRFPFPDSVKTGVRSEFDGSAQQPFKHPLGQSSLSVATPLPTARLAEEFLQVSIGGVPRNLDWKSRFFLYWRRWPEESARADERLSYLPADTRMPDHTIWNHMSLTSAMQGCVHPETNALDPAFLMFQFGPVQDFIATARRTRDFLSGSYLLGWLAAHALKAVSDCCGPDAVIFPSLRGQPIFDALYREELYEKILYGPDSLWKRMRYTAEQLLSPTLPNRFLAVVPTWRAKEVAEAATDAISKEWTVVCDAAWQAFGKLATDLGYPPETSWQTRWQGQTRGYWKITWQTWTWDADVPMEENMAKLEQLAVRVIPKEDRDARFFDHGKLNNIGFSWPAQAAQVDRLLAMRRNTREFDQFFTDGLDADGAHARTQVGARKDALSGKEESIGSKDLWRKVLRSQSDGLFKDNEGPYGAAQIVKRLFMRDVPMPYLKNKLGLDRWPPRLFDSVEDVAAKNDDDSRYVAVLAMDGDRMGAFMSGEKTPPLADQLSPEAREYFIQLDGFDRNVRRPLSPAYHLQFSEALGNFASHFARRAVEAFDGQLIYAGGDDVLAMLPADKAMACAVALRACFRGESPEVLKADAGLAHRFADFSSKLSFPAKGWIKPGGGKEDYPLLVPGPAVDISCGIAIAHQHYPLQAMIREAQAAEKRAKKEYGRAALSVSLLKRGGETVYWGCKWDGRSDAAKSDGPTPQPALTLYHRLVSLRREKRVTGRFAYALAELLQPYALHTGKFIDGLDVKELIARELDTPLSRQCSDAEAAAELRRLCLTYLDELEAGYFDKEGRAEYIEEHDGKSPPVPWSDFAKLFLTAAFLDRERKED